MTIAMPSLFCAARCSVSFCRWPGAWAWASRSSKGSSEPKPGRLSIDIRLVEPTQDERHLAQLVELQLERRLWTGGIVAVRWTAHKLGRSEQAQSSWFGDDAGKSAARAFNSLVDRLSSRLDSQAVLRAEVVPDAQPEHAVRLVPWTSPHAT